MRLLAVLFDLMRDIAIVAAAAGIAWWCWDQYRTSAERGDQAARAGLLAERQSADLKLWAEKLDERTTAISAHLAHVAQIAQLAQAAQTAQATAMAEARSAWANEQDMRLARAERDAEERMSAKVRVHRLLHGTTDPFLTFVEIEKAIADGGPSGNPHARGEAAGADDPAPIAGDLLRRVLIELVSDGVVAQLDQDRYFIASDYEAGGDDSDGADGDDTA